MPAPLVSIRWSLLRNLIALVVILTIATITVAAFNTQRIVRKLSGHIIEHAASEVHAQLDSFFTPVHVSLEILADDAASGLLVEDDIEAFLQQIMPLLRSHAHVSSINTGHTDGRSVMVMRTDTGWLCRSVTPAGGALHTEYFAYSASGELMEQFVDAESSFDPRERPWFIDPDAASSHEHVHWTSAYSFFTTGEPGITASRAVRTPDNRHITIAIDVLLNELSAFTRSIHVSENGFAMVLDEQANVLGLPRPDVFADRADPTSNELIHLDELDISVVKDGIRAVGGQAADQIDALADGRTTTYEFASGHGNWWAGVRIFELSAADALRVVVLVPDSDFMGDIATQRLWVAAIALLILIFAIIRAAVLSSRYSQPLQSLVEQSDRLSHLDTQDAPPVRTNIKEVRRLFDSQNLMRSALDSFARYVPTEVVRQLLAQGEAARIGGRTETITMLFSDIAGFTTIAESMEPAALTAHASEYFEQMIAILRSHDATVDKLIGDAIVAFWGAPLANEDHAADGIRAVLACRDKLEELNATWQGEGKPPLFTRFALATGPAVVGNIGAPSRLNFTALGDTVNLASRVESLNKMYGTAALITDATREAARLDIVYRRVDAVVVRGRSTPVTLFEPIGERSSISGERMAFVDAYERGLAHYQAGRFDEALTELESAPEAFMSDKSLRRLRALCQGYRGFPPDGSWTGVTHLDRRQASHEGGS